MRTRLLYAAASATGDNVCTYDVVSSTRLIAVQWAVHFTSITAASNSVILLSRAAASQFATNNVPDILSIYVMNSNFVTSGLAQPQGNFLAPIDQVLKTGDRIAMHYQETGTVVAAIYALLYFAV
jgi:hypothetical protein